MARDKDQVKLDFILNSDEGTRKTKRNLSDLIKLVEQLNKETNDFAKALGGVSLRQATRQIAGGGVNSQLVNAKIAGFQNQVRAQKSSETINLASNRSFISTPANNIKDLNKQLEISAIRLANINQLAADKFAKGSKANATFIQNEINLNKALLAQKERLIPIEKQLAVEQARANKINMLLGDGGASLFKIQAGLALNGIALTSFFKAFSFGAQYIIQFDKSLKELQAVTDTTNTEMKSLSKTFVDVSLNSKFSAVELANAAVTLGQAGLSASQINKSIESVSLLATATGSDLATSVDVVSSALTVFNINASETEHVANTMTGALNLSKLTMEKLQLGIQYAGNAAAESGITLEELTAALGAMANAGIKSGSSLGTGLTQLIVELQNPTKKLVAQLDKVGLTIDDVDIKSHGLVTVLETMKKAGFGSADAFKAMDLRGARSFLALSRNTEAAKEMEVAFQLSSAATKANDTQMNSLANSGAKLANTFGAVLLEMGEPLKQVLITSTNLLSGTLAILNQFPLGLQALGVGLSGVFSAVLLKKIVLLSANLLGFAAAETTATVATTGLTRAFVLLGSTGIGRLAGIISLAMVALVGLSAATDDNSQSADELQAEVDKTKGAYDSTIETINSVDTEIDRLTNRYDDLSKNQSSVANEVVGLQSRFKNYTTELSSNTITTIDQLLLTLKNLKVEMRGVANEQLQLMAAANSNAFVDSATSIANKYKPGIFGKKATASGVELANLADKQAQTGLNSLSPEQAEAFNKQYIIIKQNADKAQTIANKEAERLKREIAEGQKNGKLSDLVLMMKNGELRKQEEMIKKTAQVAQDAVTLANSNSVAATTKKRSLELEIQQDENYIKLEEQQQSLIKKQKQAKTSAAKIAAAEGLKEFRGNLTSNPLTLGIKGDQERIQDVVSSQIGEPLSLAISEADETISRTTKEIGQGSSKYLGSVTRIQDLSLKQLERELRLATQDADVRIAKIDSILQEATNTESGGLRGQYSDAEIFAMQQTKKKIEDEKISLELKSRTESVEKYKELVELAEKELTTVKANKHSYEDYTKALDNFNEAKDKQITNDQIIAKLQTEEQARNGTLTEGHISLGDQIGLTLEEYKKQIDIQNDVGLNIKKNITEGLDEARGSFKNFLKDWMSGTATAGDAFRSFAVGVIGRLQDMAAESLTGPLFKGLTGGISSLFQSPTQVAIGQSILANPQIFNSGGSVRNAATGTAVPTRDSVNIKARPGEYVLRNSAVDLIGRSNLDLINSYGNRNIQTSSSALSDVVQNKEGLTQSAPVNVYVVSPEAKPSLTKNDVLVTIQEDMAKGGQTIKLIKQIVRS